MRLRQEQIVFAVVLLAVSFKVWSHLTEAQGRGRSRARAEEAEIDHHVAPDVVVALARGTERLQLTRELFSPPRDTRPLPPLELIEPPRQALPGLSPPTAPGPAARNFGKLLRTELIRSDDPDLFVDSGEGAGDDVEFFDLRAGDSEPVSAIGALRDAARAEAEANPHADETPADRAARFAGYRKRYDWIRRGPGDTIFGRIENEDRYSLEIDSTRASEPLLFVQIEPDTGRETFASVGAPAIPVERGAMQGFGFAENVANEIELRRRRIGDALTRGTYDEALALADFAVRNRLAASRALVVAEELYKLGAVFDAEDPEPRLGLARCYEAGFSFEEAFVEYEALLEAFPHRAEVHVRQALLEERFLMLEEAEARMRRAVEVNRGSWEAQWGLGSLLHRRGKHEGAVEHLQLANRVAPQDPRLLHVRVGIRTDLADALFALGAVDRAHAVYGQALAADADSQEALAGTLATALYSAELVPPPGLRASGEGEGFELLLVRGVTALKEGEYAKARDLLGLAAETDPLRASRALGALSYLAEITGNEAEAVRFAEEALEGDPRDAYALFQRGRLLGLQDDYEGARASLLGALDVELDFEDALVALGDTAFRLGRFEDAERYLERATRIDDARPEVHTLRGLNHLRLGAVLDARDAFGRALELDPDDATARAGNSWCTYLEGDVTEALIQLANLDEARRNFSDDDPWRVWSREQIERIQDHVEKVEWTDGFNRKRLINGWLTRESAGPVVAMQEGAVQVEGVFDKTGSTLVFREYPAGLFLSFSARVWVAPESNVRTGVFVARERQRRDTSEVIGGASVSRQKEGSLQVRVRQQGQPAEVTDMEQGFPTGEWVKLRIEKTGDATNPAVTVSMDGIPLVQNVSLGALGRTSTPLMVGLFVEGETGRRVLVKMDDAAVVYRQGP